MDDSTVIALLLSQAPDAVEALMARHGGLMRYVAGGILRDAAETESCVNEVCLLAWTNILSYDGAKGNLTTWLTALTRNAALNRIRTIDRYNGREDPLENNLPDRQDTPEEALLRKERIQQLAHAINQLSHRDKLLFYRKYYYTQSTAQIGAELGLTERAVEGRLYRLRKRLQKLLGKL